MYVPNESDLVEPSVCPDACSLGPTSTPTFVSAEPSPNKDDAVTEFATDTLLAVKIPAVLYDPSVKNVPATPAIGPILTPDLAVTIPIESSLVESS